VSKCIKRAKMHDLNLQPYQVSLTYHQTSAHQAVQAAPADLEALADQVVQEDQADRADQEAQVSD
jgi:hypothetical protein